MVIRTHQSLISLCFVNLLSYTHDIEAVSCDEMLVDLGEVLSETGATPLQFASLLREEIFSQTKCTASAGIGEDLSMSLIIIFTLTTVSFCILDVMFMLSFAQGPIYFWLVWPPELLSRMDSIGLLISALGRHS